MTGGRCPACDATGLETFHDAEGVPTNSCLLLDDPVEARGFPRGRLRLALCPTCGLITNTEFDPALAEYSSRYEETQAFSPRFVDFARDLAKRWVERHDLRGGHVLEIGCGKGEFLTWMVEAGVGSGVGIDPGVHPERLDGDAPNRIEWIAELYDDRYAHLEADAVVCRHTLEHIHPVREFLTTLRRNIGARHGTVLLFELPDTQRILDETAFWDVYYEHCSYFTRGSLTRLFETCGFDVLSVRRAYEDQYLVLEALPSGSAPGLRRVPAPADEIDALRRSAASFARTLSDTVAEWRSRLRELTGSGGRAVVWGGGSKGVAFLTTLGIEEEIPYVVDINPHKQGRYIAGTGQLVVGPDSLQHYRPDLVILMNPAYREEVRSELEALEVPANVQAM